MPKLGGGSWSGSVSCSSSGPDDGMFPRAGTMTLSRLFDTNISTLRASPGFLGRGAAGASASGTRGGACGLAGSGRGVECGATCGFGAGSATGCDLCNCGEDTPAPGACRGGTAASGDNFAPADGTVCAFGGPFAADCFCSIGFAGCGGLATDALEDEDDGADDGSTATMALVSLGTIRPNHDFGADFAPGFGPDACAIAGGLAVAALAVATSA